MTKPWSDSDPIETKEWLDALSSLIKYEGKERAEFIISALLNHAQTNGVSLASTSIVTPYVNTLSALAEPPYPGNLELEAKIEAYIRWNAIAMVLKAKKSAGGVGGHLSSFASIATLYEVGMQHFFRGATKDQLGDLIYFQGHSSEGNYARAFLEGRLSEKELTNFRQEIKDKGLSSYPHPWLMPDFWQFATVSLGLGLLQGIYQARFIKYLHNRGLLKAADRKVWIFAGDGEMDEPESIAGITMAVREKLDNLIFVVNCNLQRLDGLVRGNSKIVQELEGLFRGAGWHVIKVLWDSKWNELFAKDKSGLLAKRLTECVDGDLQTAQVRGGAYTREFLFNTPELAALVADWSDADIEKLHRGAHDPIKVYAAYKAASEHQNQPVVLLMQGVKGYGLGSVTAEGRNVAHNHLEMTDDELKTFRDRFKLPLTDQQLFNYEFVKPAKNSEETQYLLEQRKKLGGFLPARQIVSAPLSVPNLDAFASVFQGSEDRTMSTTMVLGRILNIILKDKQLGPRVVPIFSDEVRTFGLETLFRQFGIYSPVGQLYTPEDKEQFLYYHETESGQVLEEGITEAGCMASWIAAATSYATHRLPMIPFFTYYSMFGFQRIGDFIWAACDMRARGFLIGGTAGRTTLEGEGLQHQDGNSLLTASTFPSVKAYDPAYGYEMAVIIQRGLKEMMQDEKDVIYYIMAMNERYIQPAMPKGVEEGILRGIYLFQKQKDATVQLFGSGAILNEVVAAADLLANEFNIKTNVWSVTSYSELRRDGLQVDRKNRQHPDKKPAVTYIESVLADYKGPIIAASDYVKAYPDLIRPYLSRPFYTLGTDGYGRSDTRERLRDFFEVNRFYIVVTTLYALAKEGKIPQSDVAKAMTKYGLDPQKPNPSEV